MPLTKKERTRRALERRPIDRLPTQVNCTSRMGSLLAEYFGVPLTELDERLDNHLLRIDISYPKRTNLEGTIAYDWWGAGWDTRTEGYWHADFPLKSPDDLDSYRWPDPSVSGLVEPAGLAIDRFIVPNFGMCLFERAWSLRGFDNLLMDMLDQPEWVEQLLDGITTIQLQLAKRFITAGVDGGYFGDDYGGQRAMLFSPRLWRRFMKPRLARMAAIFRDAGLPVILHSDGDIKAILPDLAEIGITTLNPVQPEVLEHEWLAREFGGYFSFYGGISTQLVLPGPDPAVVRSATRSCAQQLARNGTGLLLGPSHRMQSDIPPSNVAAMLEAFHDA